MGTMLAEGSWETKSFDLEDVQVVFPSKDVAVIGFRVHEDLIVDGEPLAFDAADSSVWVRNGDDWSCTAHTESVLGDPMGRDRVKPS